MPQFSTLIAATAGKATIGDALPYLLGFLVVLVTLTLLWLICSVIGKAVSALMPPAEAARPAKTAAPAEISSEDGIPPEIVAVIVAAVAATEGKPRRIVSVQPYDPAWTQAGRQVILTSHKIR